MRNFLRLPSTDKEFAEKASRINSTITRPLGIAARFSQAMSKRKPIKEVTPTEIIAAPPVPPVEKEKTIIHPKKMKKWPENPTELVAYEKLVSPLKDILQRGYRLFRKNEVTTFDYEGYNIGKLEQKFYPPPNYRFMEKFLTQENSRGRTLLDIVLSVMFLLGVEQGRRAERKSFKPMETMLETLDSYREMNKDLRIKIDELEVLLEIKESNSDVSDDELNRLVQEKIGQRRAKRIEHAKSELSLDHTRTNFQFSSVQRARFKDLERIANSLSKDNCTVEQWQEILQQKGWTHQEWKDKCKKKHITTWLAK